MFTSALEDDFAPSPISKRVRLTTRAGPVSIPRPAKIEAAAPKPDVVVKEEVCGAFFEFYLVNSGRRTNG